MKQFVTIGKQYDLVELSFEGDSDVITIKPKYLKKILDACVKVQQKKMDRLKKHTDGNTD